MKVTAFLPCRRGSQRVPGKNTRSFCKFHFGLVELKVLQLLEVKNLDRIVLSTNDLEILDFARTINSEKLFLHERAEHLSSSETSTDDLVEHALSLIPEGHILWTHTTSPLVQSSMYDKIINSYEKIMSEGFDSLMTVSPLYGFIWNDDGPINYDREIEKWPRTQTLEPLYEVNSAVFLSSAENYKRFNDRIGRKPFLYMLDKIVGFDIDWEEDFLIAEHLYKVGV